MRKAIFTLKVEAFIDEEFLHIGNLEDSPTLLNSEGFSLKPCMSLEYEDGEVEVDLESIGVEVTESRCKIIWED